MGGTCCSDRTPPLSSPPAQLPKELNLTSLRELQEDLAVHYREIARSRETLTYIHDESKGIDKKLTAVERLFTEEKEQIAGLQERTKVVITLRLLQLTLESNLTRAGFSTLIQTHGRDVILKRLTAMTSESRSSTLDEVLSAAEFTSLEALLGETVSTAQGHLPVLSDISLQLQSYSIRIGGLKMQVEGPLSTMVEKRGRILMEMRDVHQQNLVRCVIHEAEIVDSHKALNPTQTLDQFQAAERQNLENRQECQNLQRLLEEMHLRTLSNCDEIAKLKVSTEYLISNTSKELKPPHKKRKIGSELDDDLSSLDLGDSKKPISEVSFDPETEAFYVKRVNDLRKSLATENSKVEETEVGLQEMEIRVERSKNVLKDQKVKGMYFIFSRYITILAAKGLRTWKVRVEERKKARKMEKLKEKAAKAMGDMLKKRQLRAIQGVWDEMSGVEMMREDRP
jgi:hypothetical protein